MRGRGESARTIRGPDQIHHGLPKILILEITLR